MWWRGRPPPPRVNSGDEPDMVLPLLHPSVHDLRGGADGEGDSDSCPVGPHMPGGPKIIEDRVLSGTERYDVHRIVRVPAEDSDMDVNIEELSVASGRILAADSEPEVVGTKLKAGPSKPLKRARGRPRKDGTGPFKSPSPTNEDLVELAFQGEAPGLNVLDIVPQAERPAVRRAGG